MTQEVWLRALAVGCMLVVLNGTMSWLVTVANTLLRNEWKPERIGEAELDHSQPEPRDPQAARLLAWALGKLPLAQAELIAEHHLDGRSWPRWRWNAA